MTKKACCCGSCPTEDWRCCKPWFRDQFVNIFDKWMDSAAPVSPSDLIVLKINRPESKNGPRIYTWRAGGVCHCGKQCCTPACYAEDLASSPCMACQRNKKCILTPSGDPACVGGNEFANTAERGSWCGQDAVAACCLPCQPGGGSSFASLLG